MVSELPHLSTVLGKTCCRLKQMASLSELQFFKVSHKLHRKNWRSAEIIIVNDGMCHDDGLTSQRKRHASDSMNPTLREEHLNGVSPILVNLQTRREILEIAERFKKNTSYTGEFTEVDR